MNFILHTIRFLVTAFACALLFFSSAYPAAAIGSTKSNPSEGEVNLNKIQQKTDETIQAPPTTLREVQERSQGGLNEVQGAADANKMKNPENSQKATSFIDEVKGTLKDITQ